MYHFLNYEQIQVRNFNPIYLTDSDRSYLSYVWNEKKKNKVFLTELDHEFYSFFKAVKCLKLQIKSLIITCQNSIQQCEESPLHNGKEKLK